jgi:hypothetical protein
VVAGIDPETAYRVRVEAHGQQRRDAADQAHGQWLCSSPVGSPEPSLMTPSTLLSLVISSVSRIAELTVLT